MFRFTIRDVLWLTVVVALAVGWGIDQVRIRRERIALKTSEKALTDEITRLQSLSIRQAQARLAVAEAELASMKEIKQRSPGAISAAEMRRVEAQAEVAKLSVEAAAAKEEALASLRSSAELPASAK